MPESRSGTDGKLSKRRATGQAAGENPVQDVVPLSDHRMSPFVSRAVEKSRSREEGQTV
jgi:hypothetical protein